MAEIRFCSSFHCVQNLNSGFLSLTLLEIFIQKFDILKNICYHIDTRN